MFEAPLVSDETAVRRGLGFEKKPKDWPSFATYARDLGSAVIAPAVACATGNKKSYRTAKARWARKIVDANLHESARMWKHEIATRLCRRLTS